MSKTSKSPRKVAQAAYRIAKNTAIDFLRKKKILLYSDFEEEDSNESAINNIPDPAPLPDEIFDRQNLKDELETSIKKLPVKYQMVVSLHNLEELTFHEIAEMLEEPLNTIKSRYLRALSIIRRDLFKS